MGLLLAVITGAIVWVVAWALGLKSVDGFMIGLGIVVLVATGRLLVPALFPGRRGGAP